MSSTLDILLEMGFSKAKAERALNVTQNQGVEAAMEWLLVHCEELEMLENKEESAMNVSDKSDQEQEENKSAIETMDAERSEAEVGIEATADEAKVAKSLQCDECGKLFKNEIDVEYHAAKTGHQSFSESVQEIKPLTDEEKKEQLRKLEEKIKQRRADKEEELKRERIEKEKMRRRTGQQIIEAKKKMEEDEIRKIAEQRRREKVEEKLARQRVLEQIERDKIARKKKFENIPSETVASSSDEAVNPVMVSQVEPSNVTPKKEYTETKLQIRLTNGTTLSQSFGVKEELAAVRLFVEINRTDGTTPFHFMTSFPRKIFNEEDMEKPLYQLGLVPSAVLILTK